VTGPQDRTATGSRPLAGLVLCGGSSSRMGRDKALMEIDGVPLVIRIVSLVAEVADPVLLAPGSPGRLGDLGYPEVADDPAGVGPLGGLLGGLARSPHHLLAVVAVDMPFASPKLLGLLADLHAGEDAVVPVTDSGVEPLHAVYAATAVAGLRRSQAAGRPALQLALQGLRVRRVEEREWRSADPTGRFAVNVNRPEDLTGLF
jgi:molybdopterin-guanine dinucleotide biosynthesis protein A